MEPVGILLLHSLLHLCVQPDGSEWSECCREALLVWTGASAPLLQSGSRLDWLADIAAIPATHDDIGVLCSGCSLLVATVLR